jgi:beta-glucosidase
MPKVTTEPHQLVDGRDPASKSTLLQAAIEGHVLVKNIGKSLPLKWPKLLSLFGFDAFSPLVNNPSSIPYDRWHFGLVSVGVPDQQLLALLGGLSTQSPGTATNGTLTVGGGSGASTGSYISGLTTFSNSKPTKMDPTCCGTSKIRT